MSYRATDRFENWFITSLQTGINDTTGSFRLNDNLNVSQARLVIDPYDESVREVVKVTSVDGNLVYTERGDDNTQPQYHLEGAVVALNVAAADMNDLYADWAEADATLTTLAEDAQLIVDQAAATEAAAIAAASSANSAANAASTAAADTVVATNNANSATANANSATTNANNATSSANTAASQANTAKDAANTATSAANTATTNANTARTNANNAAAAATTATTNANNATSAANTAASNATTVANNLDAFNLSIGIVSTGTPAASITGTMPNKKLNLALQKGDKGDTGTGLPVGGTAGMTLLKNSSTDYDYSWQVPPTAPVVSVAGKVGDVTLSAADLTATGITNAKYLRGDNTWQTPPNTTYSEITSAEITTGTASTARSITGRRVQEIVNKAQTGVVKTTGNQAIAGDLDVDGEIYSNGEKVLDENSVIPAENVNFATKTADTFVQNGFTYLTGTGSAFIAGGDVTFSTPIPESKLISVTATCCGYKTSDPTGPYDSGLVIWETPTLGYKFKVSGGNVTGFTYTIGVASGSIPSGRRVAFSWTALAL